ncbi:MAG: hypothetical protein JRE16_08885 [Deltaproteobacteria bacterium]|jgi:antitoxin component of RelBE/YafQ-DinJ toxin-antitoxin module|nr:hypothetical protein [Deltaproteobacteria bacterium]MBW2504669.1 hypothetical protein [Deltaproteobacteria bacterium]MBW2518895.1 hypothetical protein [Deltaproteobacteria bacterium]
MKSQGGPKKYVLSFRINEEEWQLLQDVIKESGQDVSSLLRQSLKEVVRESRAE